MVIIGWMVAIGIILFFSFKLIDQIKSYVTELEVRIDLLEESVRILDMKNEDCEDMINTLSQRISDQDK